MFFCSVQIAENVKMLRSLDICEAAMVELRKKFPENFSSFSEIVRFIDVLHSTSSFFVFCNTLKSAYCSLYEKIALTCKKEKMLHFVQAWNSYCNNVIAGKSDDSLLKLFEETQQRAPISHKNWCKVFAALNEIVFNVRITFCRNLLSEKILHYITHYKL